MEVPVAFLYQMIAETGKETAILMCCYPSYESDLKLKVSFYVIFRIAWRASLIGLQPQPY